MRCSHCGRELTNAALQLGYCPSCGELVTQNNSQDNAQQRKYSIKISQPEDLNEPSSALIQSAHGTIQQPEEPPKTQQPSAQLQKQSAAPAAVSSKHLENSGSQLPQPVITNTVVARKSNTGLIAIILFSVLAIMALSVGALFLAKPNIAAGILGNAKTTPAATQQATATATSAPTATPTITPTPLPTVPAPPQGYTAYTDPSHHFGFDYTTSWNANAPSTLSNVITYTFETPDLKTKAVINQVTNGAITPNNIGVNYLANFSTGQNGQNFQVTQAAAQFTSGANTWVRAEGQYTVGGQSYTCVGLALIHENQGYIIIYSAPTASFDDSAGTPFAEMISSFTFLN